MRPMKDSGIEWIGKIPEGWETCRLKNLADPLQENSFIDGDWIESPDITDEGIRYLTTGNVGDGLYKRQGNGYISQETFKDLNCKYAYPGDLVIARLNAPYGRSCILEDDEDRYVLAVDIVILRTLQDKRYICYFTQCPGYQRAVEDYSRGTAMKRISRSNLGNIDVLLPPLAEQQAIADYLDEKCAAIDKLIDNQKAQIEKMKEYKQSVITEAVTKGLNPSVPMKDSGIEWIGKIPEGWGTSRVGLHYDIVLGKMLCSEQATPQHTLGRYYCAANVHFGEISPEDELKEMWFSEAEKQSYGIKEGDLLVVEGGAGAGGCAIASRIQGEVYIQNSILRVRAKEGNDNRYLRYYIESMVKRNYIDIVCNKATIPHFTKDKLGAMPYIVMSLAEQQAIADYLDEKCAAIDKLIAIKQAKIDKLNDYKKSLIYEYVTGKREVL